MNDAYDYVCELVAGGKTDYTALSTGEKEELTSLIYKNGSNGEREEWLMESEFAHHIYEGISMLLTGTNHKEASYDLADVLKDTVSHSCAPQADALFEEVIANMEFEAELRHQDEAYDSYREQVVHAS